MYLIAYDIADDRRRTRVARVLLNYGDRVQQSVFEIDVPASRLQKVVAEVRRWLDQKEDSLIVYPLCAACTGRRDVIAGTLPDLEARLFRVV